MLSDFLLTSHPCCWVRSWIRPSGVPIHQHILDKSIYQSTINYSVSLVSSVADIPRNLAIRSACSTRIFIFETNMGQHSIHNNNHSNSNNNNINNIYIYVDAYVFANTEWIHIIVFLYLLNIYVYINCAHLMVICTVIWPAASTTIDASTIAYPDAWAHEILGNSHGLAVKAWREAFLVLGALGL